MTETFVKERKHNSSRARLRRSASTTPRRVPLRKRFKNGSLATFESTRYARGHKRALHLRDQRRARPPIRWDLHDSCIASNTTSTHKDEGFLRGWKSIHAITDSDHPYMKHWWVPGLQIGYEHTFRAHQVADFLESHLRPGKPGASDVPRRRRKRNLICDAVSESRENRMFRKRPNSLRI